MYIEFRNLCFAGAVNAAYSTYWWFATPFAVGLQHCSAIVRLYVRGTAASESIGARLPRALHCVHFVLTGNAGETGGQLLLTSSIENFPGIENEAPIRAPGIYGSIGVRVYVNRQDVTRRFDPHSGTAQQTALGFCRACTSRKLPSPPQSVDSRIVLVCVVRCFAA